MPVVSQGHTFPSQSIRYKQVGSEYYISVNDLYHQLFLQPNITGEEILEQLSEKRVFKEVASG